MPTIITAKRFMSNENVSDVTNKQSANCIPPLQVETSESNTEGENPWFSDKPDQQGLSTAGTTLQEFCANFSSSLNRASRAVLPKILTFCHFFVN
jgi:hypothetical protein